MALRVDDSERIRQAIAEVHSSSSGNKWVLCGRLKGSKNVLKFIASGSGGLEDIGSHLHHDDMLVMYGLIDLSDSFVFVTWYNMSFEKRLTSYSREIAVLFMPYHSWIHIDLKSKTDLTEILTKKKFSSASSSCRSSSLPESITA